MLIPSATGILAGALLIAALVALDWYIWGLNLVSNPRQPRRSPQPLTGLELIDLGLGRLIAANKAVLPKAAFEPAHQPGVPVKTDPDDGFKRVA
jgi:hypothetical protein